MWIYPFLIIYLIVFAILKWVPSIPHRQDWISANHFVLAVGALFYLILETFVGLFFPWYAGYLSASFHFLQKYIKWLHLIYPILFLLSLFISLSYFREKNRINLHLNNWLAIFLSLHALHYLANGTFVFGYTTVTSGWHTTIGTPIIPTNFLILIPIVLLTNFLLVYFKILPEIKRK